MGPFIMVAVGGAIGAMLRYGVSCYAASKWGTFFPVGTLLVNVSGCLIIAFLTFKGLESGVLSPQWRLLLIVGIGGAFTTFSSFSVETLILIKDGLYNYAILNVISNVFLGLLAAVLGLLLARTI